MKNAFTLIELLVVISIIGILIGLSVFGLQGARKASRDAVRKSDLEQIRSGLGFYKTDCNTYPLTADFPSPGDPLSGSGVGSCLNTNTYISKVPIDPISGDYYSYKSTDGVTYYLCASLEQSWSANPDDLSNCSACGANPCNYVTKNP